MKAARQVALFIAAAVAAAAAQEQDPRVVLLESRAQAAHATRAPHYLPPQELLVRVKGYYPEGYYPERYYYPGKPFAGEGYIPGEYYQGQGYYSRGYYREGTDYSDGHYDAGDAYYPGEYYEGRSSYPHGRYYPQGKYYESKGGYYPQDKFLQIKEGYYARKAAAAQEITMEEVLAKEGDYPQEITMEEVLAAQQAWGASLVDISVTYDEQGLAAARAVASEVIDQAYGYQYGPVLFKPTLAYGNQTFRTTRAGCLAYFVGGDPAFPTDTGFALKSWRNYRAENAAVFLHGDTAATQGNVFLTDKHGAVTIVDKTWMFVKCVDGSVRIVVHHSSLPYAPAKATTATTTTTVTV